jgi:hypothetical protein
MASTRKRRRTGPVAPPTPSAGEAPATTPQVGDVAGTGTGTGMERMLGGGPDSIYDAEGEAQLEADERRAREGAQPPEQPR